MSKRVSPREAGNGRRNFCFIDFTTREEAQAAKLALNGFNFMGGPLKVTEAVPKADRYGSRERLDRDIGV